MKKSLILSVVMTLVLVISMSTATFAWYTANNSVTANVNTITAATATGNLAIEMSEGTNDGTAEATRTLTGSIKPIAPNASLAGADNVWTQGTWKGWNLDVDNKARDNGATFDADVVKGTITVTNQDASSATGAISVSVSITGDNAANAEVVLVYNNTIVCSSAYNYGGATVNDEGKLDAATTAEAIEGSTLATTLTSIAASQSAVFNYYIWFDGFTIANANQAQSADVTFTFTAA